VNITPGVDSPHGEGYFRLSLRAPDARLEERWREWRNSALITTSSARARGSHRGVFG